jgi:hypothetical protein
MPNVTTRISFSDLVGDTPERAAAREAKFEREKRVAVRAQRRKTEVARATEIAKRTEHLLPATTGDADEAGREDPDSAWDAREARIKQSIEKSLTHRLAIGLEPMKAKQLAVELAHFNMVHLSSHSVKVLERVAEYASDPTSDHHEWALKFMAERALPLKLAQDAQMDAAGLRPDSVTPRAPEVHIHVGAAVPVRQSDIIDAIPVVDT